MPNGNKTCPTCGGALIQKSILKLFLAAVVLMGTGAVVFFLNFRFWPLVVLPFITGVYLLAWGTLGKGYWCRQCKNFPYK